jgi:hypothetical protein
MLPTGQLRGLVFAQLPISFASHFAALAVGTLLLHDLSRCQC